MKIIFANEKPRHTAVWIDHGRVVLDQVAIARNDPIYLILISVWNVNDLCRRPQPIWMQPIVWLTKTQDLGIKTLVNHNFTHFFSVSFAPNAFCSKHIDTVFRSFSNIFCSIFGSILQFGLEFFFYMLILIFNFSFSILVLSFTFDFEFQFKFQV